MAVQLRDTGNTQGRHASDELLEDSALAALTIVAAGMLPLIVLNYGLTRTRPDEPS